MITRTTTVGTLKNYRYNLNASNKNMAYTMNKVITERYFNSYAEDPALATRCFQLRRSFMRTNSELSVNQSTWHKYDVAWSALDGVTTDLYKITGTDTKDAAFKSIITALNDPDGSGRNALGQSMAAKARGMVQTMNGRYGENYVFAGADHLNVPFTWGGQQNPDYVADEEAMVHFQYLEDDGNGNYVGTNVDEESLTLRMNDAYQLDADLPAGVMSSEELDPEEPDNFKYFKYLKTDPETGNILHTNEAAEADRVLKDDPTKNLIVNEDYNEMASYKYLTATGEGTNKESEAHSVLYYRGVEVDSMADGDLTKMDYFVKDENRYMDLGLGFKEENGEAISSTVFDAGLQGVYYLGGYGTGEYTAVMGEGENAREVKAVVPNNVISIVNRMSEILLSCSPEDGSWAKPEDEEEFYVLAQKYEDTISLVGQRYAEMDTEASFLRDNQELLTATVSSLSEQITELEHVNAADAITEYMFARYVYDAALKVGNSVLSQSLMDYMSF